MGKISVVINTRNEARNLKKSLSSVRNFADEIIVVDMESVDDSRKIAKKYGAKVFVHKALSYVEPARNFAIEKATGDWILILDPDEVVPKTLQAKLKEIVAEPTAHYFRIPRKNIIFGKWMENSRWWPDHNLRFFMKGNVKWSEVIHAVPETEGKGLDLPAKEEYALLHYHYDSVEQYITRLNRYTTAHAKLLIKNGYKFQWQDIIKRPMNEFLSRYFFGEGYKDGLHGLAISSLQGLSELVLYLKAWQMQEKFKEHKLLVSEVISTMKESESDMHYWQADTLLKETGKLKHRIKRKFKLS